MNERIELYHPPLRFSCHGCGREYRDPADLFRCVEGHMHDRDHARKFAALPRLTQRAYSREGGARSLTRR